MACLCKPGHHCSQVSCAGSAPMLSCRHPKSAHRQNKRCGRLDSQQNMYRTARCAAVTQQSQSNLQPQVHATAGMAANASTTAAASSAQHIALLVLEQLHVKSSCMLHQDLAAEHCRMATLRASCLQRCVPAAACKSARLMC